MSRRRPVVVQWLDPVASSPIEAAVGALLLIALGLLGMVWGAATLSSWLIAGDRATIPVDDAALALFQLGANRLRWDGAWSAEIEESLAGPVWFWFFFAIEAFIVSLLFWPMWRMFGPRPDEPAPVYIEPTPAKHPRAERRAAAREERARRRMAATSSTVATGLLPSPVAAPGVDRILTERPGGNQVVLGRAEGRYLATYDFHSVVAFGPTQSGKTSALTVPALLDWPGPALVVSAKPDLISATWRQRAERGGKTWLFDPMGSMAGAEAATDSTSSRGVAGDGWSPLQLIASVPTSRNQPELDRRVQQWARARRTAHWMVGAARSNQVKGELPEPWFVVAEQMLAPMLLAAAADELLIGQVAEWVDRREVEAVTLALERTAVAEAQAAWEGARNQDPATTAGTYQILALIMTPYSDPRVLGQARNPVIDPRALLDREPSTLYVLSPPHHQQGLRPLMTTLVSEVLETAMGQATGSPAGRLPAPLMVIFDDAAESAPLQLLDQLASVGAGLGIQLMTMFQDLGHVERAFGADEAMQVADSHRVLVVLPGVSDVVTLDYVNSLIHGSRLVGAGDRPDPEADPDDALVLGGTTWIRTLDDDHALCVYGNLPPIRMALRPWYRDRSLRVRVEPPAVRRPWWRRLFGGRQRTASTGSPNPFDSAANDRESERYWEQVRKDGTLASPRAFDDGTGDG